MENFDRKRISTKKESRIANCYMSCAYTVPLEGNRVNRKEAIALLVELGSHELVSPDVVVLELRSPEEYHLKIMGGYNFKDIGFFLKNRFLTEESKNYLVISTL